MERCNVSRAMFEQEIAPAGVPVVLKGLANDWPIVAAAKRSHQSLAAYLQRFDSGAPVETMVGPPDMKGRYFFNADMTGFNFDRATAPLAAIIDHLLSMVDQAPHVMLYAGSAPTSVAAPGLATDNPMPLLDADIEPRLWLGNASRVAAHYDNSRNIACCVSGRRRFLLFPPDQIGNLYPGPPNVTIAGPPVSMVDFHAPDYDRFPRFRDAQNAALIAELNPGDALYIPTLWWHHVEAEGPFNLLVNYWWSVPNGGSVLESVMLALMDLRDQPAPERKAWQAFFDYFVFGKDAANIADHLPAHWQQLTGPKTRQRDERIMGFIMSQLENRMRK